MDLEANYKLMLREPIKNLTLISNVEHMKEPPTKHQWFSNKNKRKTIPIKMKKKKKLLKVLLAMILSISKKLFLHLAEMES